MRAHGPYKHGRRYRVVTVAADGDRGRRTFASEGEALEYLATFDVAAHGVGVAAAVERYLEHAATIRKASTVTTLGYRLASLLRTKERERPIATLTPATAARLLERRRGEASKRTSKLPSIDTLVGELAAAQGFGAWCVQQGLLRRDPFAELKVTGIRARGKAQLRIDEARRFVDTALGEASLEGLAAAMALLMGLRASELVDRQVRDVDDGGPGPVDRAGQDAQGGPAPRGPRNPPRSPEGPVRGPGRDRAPVRSRRPALAGVPRAPAVPRRQGPRGWPPGAAGDPELDRRDRGERRARRGSARAYRADGDAPALLGARGGAAWQTTSSTARAAGRKEMSYDLNDLERKARAVYAARDAYEEAPAGSDAESAALRACEATEHGFFDATGHGLVVRLRELEAVATAAVDWIVASKQAAKVRRSASLGPGASPVDLAEIERLDKLIVRSRAEMERLLTWRVRRAEQGDPCCSAECPDMATHFARTGDIP